jgi:hypothetical protein
LGERRPHRGWHPAGSRSVVEVLTSGETLEKAGYITVFEAKRIRTRIERAS